MYDRALNEHFCALRRWTKVGTVDFRALGSVSTVLGLVVIFQRVTLRGFIVFLDLIKEDLLFER